MATQQRFRVWLIGYDGGTPQRWDAVPPEAVALEPAEEGALSAEEAAVFVHSFNEAMLSHPKRVWAVPVPVVVRYEGDLRRGQIVDDESIDFAALGSRARERVMCAPQGRGRDARRA